MEDDENIGEISEEELYELQNDAEGHQRQNNEEGTHDRDDQENNQETSNEAENDQEDDQNIEEDDTNNNNNTLRKSTRERKQVISYAPSTKSGQVYEKNHLNTQTHEKTVYDDQYAFVMARYIIKIQDRMNNNELLKDEVSFAETYTLNRGIKVFSFV